MTEGKSTHDKFWREHKIKTLNKCMDLLRFSNNKDSEFGKEFTKLYNQMHKLHTKIQKVNGEAA